MSSICNMDCFNCTYSDCINDDVTLTEIKDIVERDKKIRTHTTYYTPKTKGSIFYREEHIKAQRKYFHDKYYYANPEKFREQARNSYYRNRERIRERQKKYYDLNTDMILQSKKAYYEENKEEIKKKNNEYYHANKDKINARRRERARLKREEQLKNENSKDQSTRATRLNTISN